MSLDSFSLEQSKSAVTETDGTVKYQITVSATVTAGTDVNPAYNLDQNVFVYSFASDTAEATFARIASISDLGNLKNSRAAASNAGHYEYRDSTLTLKYSDLDTAINAASTLESRVSQLVAAFIKYQQQFKGISTSSMPLATDSSLVDLYSAAYSGAVTARVAAEKELSELQKAYDALKVKNEILASYEKWVTETSEVSEAVYNSLRDVFTALQVATVYAAPEVGAAQVALTNTPYFTGDKLADIYRLHQLILAQATYRDAELNSLANQEASAKSSLDDKNSEITTLSEDEAGALSNLSTFCPEVDPASLV